MPLDKYLALPPLTLHLQREESRLFKPDGSSRIVESQTFLGIGQEEKQLQMSIVGL